MFDEDGSPLRRPSVRDRRPGPGRHRRGADDSRVTPHVPLARPPDALRGAQVRPSAAAVIGGIVVVLVAIVTFTVRVWWADRSSEPHPVGHASPALGGTPVPITPGGADPSTTGMGGRAAGAGGSGSRSEAGRSGSPSGAGSGSTPVPQIKVDIVGAVRHPGVVGLPDGARVEDALAKAGGALSGADLAQLNLARRVVDGEQVRVPRPGETVAPPPAPASRPAGAAAVGAGGPRAGPINLNSATLADLDTLSGVGPVLAQRIIDWRTANGRFSSVDELGEVSGIGDKLLERLRPQVAV